MNTSSYLKKHSREFAAVIKNFKLPVKNICIVLAQSYDDEIKVEAYGIENLWETTLSLLSDSAQDAWINAQSSIELKKQKANQGVKETVTLAFDERFVPRITNIYGLKITRDKMKTNPFHTV